MKITLDLNARVTIAFIASLIGLIWQGILISTGQPGDQALITAFTTTLLATIGIGLKSDGNNGSGKSKRKDNDSEH